MSFEEWLRTTTKANGAPLSQKTIEHYVGGLRTISKEMLQSNVISKKIEDMELYELDLTIAIIFKDPSFLSKDERGNKMYSNAIKRYRCYKYLNTDLGMLEVAEETIVNNDETLTSTEKEVIIKARRGQGIYRARLMEKYDKICVMTKVSLPQVLVASHIKPWAVCDNKERIDVDNGLLLSATYDRLFDSGLITFDDKGKLKISSLISEDNSSKLNIKNGMLYDIKYNLSMKKYLEYHNQFIFVG